MNGIPHMEPRTIMDLIDAGAAPSTTRNPRMMWLVLQALKANNGACRRKEALAAVVSGSSGATEEEVEFFADNANIVRGLMDRVRTDLHDYRFVRSPGVKWEVTPLGWVTSSEAELDFLTQDEAVGESDAEAWHEQVIKLMHRLDPEAFEKFIGRLLTKAGVFDVEVTGKPSDGGIDGRGSMVNGPMSIPVFFQAKRYTGSVSSAQVRDFRGAIQGRGHVGMMFTTGTFSKDAEDEAARTQAVNIQLFDGVGMAEWLKELGMGVQVETRMVEDVSVSRAWWDALVDEQA